VNMLWLQIAAVVLFVSWCIALLSAASVKNQHADIRQSPTVMGEKPHVGEEAFVPSHPFSRWEELFSDDTEKCSVILENRKWRQLQSEYTKFKILCSKHKVAMVDLHNVSWVAHRPKVYFDDPSLMPFLWEHGYYIQVVRGNTLSRLLKNVDPFSVIVISVKDDGSQSLNHKWQEELIHYGIRSLTREHLRNSYLSLIWKKNDHQYVNLYEEHANEKLSIRIKPGDRMQAFSFPFELEAVSAGMNSGNFSSIRINGQEYSTDMRGMNIVIYDLMNEKVSAVHRVDTFVTIYEDTALYRALPEAEPNAS